MSGIRGKVFRGFPNWKCKGCPQAYEGECRAFKEPESEEEYEQRKSGQMECIDSYLAENVCPPYEPPKPKCEVCGCTLLPGDVCPECDVTPNFEEEEKTSDDDQV